VDSEIYKAWKEEVAFGHQHGGREVAFCALGCIKTSRIEVHQQRSGSHACQLACHHDGNRNSGGIFSRIHKSNPSSVNVRNKALPLPSNRSWTTKCAKKAGYPYRKGECGKQRQNDIQRAIVGERIQIAPPTFPDIKPTVKAKIRAEHGQDNENKGVEMQGLVDVTKHQRLRSASHAATRTRKSENRSGRAGKQTYVNQDADRPKHHGQAQRSDAWRTWAQEQFAETFWALLCGLGETLGRKICFGTGRQTHLPGCSTDNGA
jgi:hypothetical protein